MKSTDEILDLLVQVETLKEVPEEQLRWVLERSDCLALDPGGTLFAPEQSIDRLFIILEGSFHIKIERNGQFQVVGKFAKNDITGLLPYSRASKARGYAEAMTPAQVVSLDGKYFREMIVECHELTTALVHIMSTRIRTFTKREQQNDKMMALGKLSAGLAHELNNPSAAVVRSSQELSKHLKYLPDKFKDVMTIQMTVEQVDRVNGILFDKVGKGIQTLSLMEKSEMEDDLMDWLDDHQIDDSDEIASNFVDYGINVDDLEEVLNETPKENLSSVFNWLNQVLTTEKLVGEIEDASRRINDLVTSIKSYTHMDQAPEKIPSDIHDGINNTLVMLNHKLKKGQIEVIRDFDESIPLPEVLPGPINQVWTNLIDNAIDAMKEQDNKVLTLKTKRDKDFIEVEVRDSGTGIPEDVQDKIFDPFFTTKPIGQGTGLGLEFVQQIVKVQHNGNVYLDSKPGQTKFTVCLPIEAK